MNFEQLLQILPQQLVFGIALGSVYGLIALGYTLVYGILFMINFAHGDVFMIGAYLGWWILTGLLSLKLSVLHPIWAVPLMLGIAMSGAALVGMALEFFAYRPLYKRGASRLGPLISAIGASIFLQNAVMVTQGARMKVYSSRLLFPPSWRVQIGNVNISAIVIVITLVSLAIMIGLYYLIHKTTLGQSMRAVAEDREMASSIGININRVISLTFLIGSALGGAAGVLIGIYYTQIDFFMGYSAGLKAFTAAILGGIGNIQGAMVGGLILGIIESLAVTFLDPAYRDVVVFTVLILTLIFKPTGLLGETLAEWKKI
jgi:branched-chain amino acid transport system permease protein